MTNAGQNIQQITQRRKKQAKLNFIIAFLLAIFPLLFYFILNNIGISIFIHVCCWVYTFIFFKKGQKLLFKAKQSAQGEAAEKETSLILSELIHEGWDIEYNIPLKYWGDADAFLRSPKDNYFVIDTKSDGGEIFFNGTELMKRYGQKIYSFANNKNILKAVKGQAARLKEMKDVRFVVPMLCFTKATLDSNIRNNKIEGVYILNKESLVHTLRKLDT